MLVLLSLALAESPVTSPPAPAAAPTRSVEVVPHRRYREPPIEHIVGPVTALRITDANPWREDALIQTPGWVVSPFGDSLRGVALADVPVYVDGQRRW